MTITVRATRPEEYRIATDVFANALMTARPNDEQWERSLPSWDESVSYSAWDGDLCVGHAAQFLVDTTVPGGARLPTAAVSRVGVLPTYRRRGVATAMMHTLVRDAVERGLVLMSLRASEATIYERFGFGIAGDACEVEIDPSRARPLRGAAAPGSFRFLEPTEIVEALAPLYERVAHRRPGIVSRPISWWRRYVRDAVDGSAASFVVVHADERGELDGYVHYTVKWETEGEPSGSGELHDLCGATDAVELALWSYVLDLDLVRRWVAEERPVDDLARSALRDRRAYHQRSRYDEQWLRLVDVDVALGTRSYRPAAGSVTIQVTDPLLEANSGTWRIGTDGASRTHDDPDLVADVATLSAAYLGGVPWRHLAARGAVDVRRGDALGTADVLFAVEQQPFCGSFF